MTEHESIAGADAAAEAEPIGKSEWTQAARELKARADEARWLLRLSEIVGDMGNLDQRHKRLESAVAKLEKRQGELEEEIGQAREKAEAILEEAKRKAEAILEGAGKQRAELEAEEERLRQKVADRTKEYGDLDRRWRDLRGKVMALGQVAESEATSEAS